MSAIEFGPIRPIGVHDVRSGTPSAKHAQANNPASVASGTGIKVSQMLDAGKPPVDAERVAEIRRAIETGSYPLVPTKVADAIIAAGYLLRNGE